VSRRVSSINSRVEWNTLTASVVSLAVGASGTYSLDLYPASIPNGSIATRLDIYLYISLLAGEALRVTKDGSSQDITKSGVVSFSLSTIPGALITAFGTNTKVPIAFQFQNIGNTAVQFNVPTYLAWLVYESENGPAPIYHGNTPYGTSGNYQDRYDIPNFGLWATRFLYRGPRSAFPPMNMVQFVSQAAGSVGVSVRPATVRVGNVGDGLKNLHREVMRCARQLGLDGVLRR